MLTDFGFSSDDEMTHGDGRCGTDAYISPEIWIQNRCSNSAKDIWAIAMTSIFISVSGRLPWNKAIPRCAFYKEFDLCYEEYARNPRVLSRRLPISKEFEALLLTALNPNPKKRLSLRGLRKGISKISHFLMSEEELRAAGVEAQETALMMGLAEVIEERRPGADKDAAPTRRPIPIHQVTNIFEADPGEIGFRRIPSSEDLSIPLFADRAPVYARLNSSSSNPPGLESPSLSGETVFEPVTPEMLGIAADPAVVVGTDAVPNIESAMGGLDAFQDRQVVRTVPPKVARTARKHRELPLPPTALATRVRVIHS